jgi:hypothetical protein
MSEWNKDGEAQLDGEIARLRNALGEVNAPSDGEPELRAAFRAQRATLSGRASAAARVVQHRDRYPPPARSRAVSRRRVAFAAGTLAASVAVAAIVLVGLDRYATDSDATQAARTTVGAVTRESSAAVGAGETPATAAFQPLLYSPGISPAQAYSVVRVRIPLTSLVGYGAPLDGTIEADVLVGEDGLATGIRFDTADAPLVSMVSY